MATLPRVAHQRAWLQDDGFVQYGIDWVRSRGMSGREVGVDQFGFVRAVAEQWFRPLSVLSTSAAAALRSAATSLSDEVLPPIFPYDVPDQGLVFLPTALQAGTSPASTHGISALGWTHCLIGDAPGIFITSWVGDDFEDDADIEEMHFTHVLSRAGSVRPRYLLKHAEAILCGKEAVYGHALNNAHREETTPLGMADRDPESFTHRLLYALWSMSLGGTLQKPQAVPLPPRTAQRYAGESVNAVGVPGIGDGESLLTVRKDRVEDFHDARNYFVWNVALPFGGRVI